jgi:hypothetical protein
LKEKTMSENIPIKFPAGYVTGYAVGYADESGSLSLVEAGRPMPVSLAGPAVPVALSGEASTPTQVGPYMPAPGQPVVLQLSGDWTGTVTLLRSTDGGTTRLPVTAGGEPWGVFTANACEPVWLDHESSAELYLAFEISQGTVEYRVSQ